jgi:hypothetical protein
MVLNLEITGHEITSSLPVLHENHLFFKVFEITGMDDFLFYFPQRTGMNGSLLLVIL